MSSTGNRTLGRYELVRVLGKGAMGLVYEARDPNLERRVAIKTIKVENLSEEASAEYEARFRTEARSAARLQHPNIVSVYDSDRDGDVAYLVMEFVQGEDLKHHLGAGTRFSLDQSLGMVADLLSALEYAHRQNIVHRDVKPANLLIEASGRVKLADFGVARIQDAGDATRTKGSMVGTLKYMSPEQVQGLAVDARSDLFAAGVLLYQLLTGHRPFDGDTDFAIIQQIVATQPAPPSSINPQLPPELDAVMARALAKPREARFASAREFAVALQEATGQVVDRTMVPPAGPRVSSSGGGTGSRPLRSDTSSSTVRFGAGTGEEPGSTVTQELELVYWKDVRDSDEAQDLEGFLSRFPAGIYADLARRRLRKLAGRSNGTSTGSSSGGNNAHEATRLDGATLMLDPAARGDDPATLLLQREPAPAAADPAQADVSVAGTGTQSPLVHAGAADADAHAGPDAHNPASPAAPFLEAAGRDNLPAPTPSPQNVEDVPSPSPVVATRSRRPLLIGAALAIVVLGILAYQRIAGDAAPAADGAAALAVAPATPASAAAFAASAATAAASGSSAVAQAASTTASGPAAAASTATARLAANGPSSASSQTAAKPLATASAAKGMAKGSGSATGKATVTETASTSPAPTGAAQPTPSAKPASPDTAAASNNKAPSSNPAAAASPAQACADRVLLGYQSCMGTQCALPAFFNHPVCVERRAIEKAQRDAQSNGRS